MRRARHRLRLGVRDLVIIVALLALPLWFLRLILNPWVTAVTSLEIVYDPDVPGPDRTGRWTEAEAILRSPAVITEALPDRPETRPRDTPEAALRRLMMSRGQETEANLPIVLQMRSSVSKSREDRAFLDGVVQAFGRRYGRGRVVQLYPARAYTGAHYGELDWAGFVGSCLLAAGVIFAVLRRGSVLAEP